MVSNIWARAHEEVAFFNYPEVGLKAIIAIHNTARGPSLGGCRMRMYSSVDQALEDVLRLSEGMTYKSAMANLPLGGGKACIIADPAMREGRRELFLKFGECVKSLGGRYITAEDMGTSVKDLSLVRQSCPFASGYSREEGGSGDPSPWTARGVLQGIKAALQHRYGSSNLKGKKVAVQGVGHVGSHLVDLLIQQGASCVVTDVVQSNVDSAQRTFGVEVVPADAIYDVPCDIFAPCAIGQTVNPQTIIRLKCSIIAGAANNQLSGSEMYPLLKSREILYAPDFVINSGGVINIASEFQEGGWDEAWVRKKVDAVYETTLTVFEEAERRKVSTEEVSVQLAKEKVAMVCQ